MAFTPLDEAGIPVDDQLRGWSELNVAPYDKDAVDPYTRPRVILMNGMEVESIIFSHQFARQTDDLALKQLLARGRRIDQRQLISVQGQGSLVVDATSPMEEQIALVENLIEEH